MAAKARLFAAANCRQVWEILEEPSRKSVEVAELFADDQVSKQELRAANREAAQLSRSGMNLAMTGNEMALFGAFYASLTASSASDEFPLVGAIGSAKDRQKIDPKSPADTATICREIFGNPFRPAAIDPAWLTPKVQSLAQAIYTERRFADMPLLVDALEEAGCTDADILNHCRRPGDHVRGCWVVDLLLGKF